MASDTLFAERIFELDGKELVCRFHAPFLAPGGEYRCVVEILWPENPLRRSIAGIDGVQAVLLAMRLAHTELVVSDAYKSGRLTLYQRPDLDLPPHYDTES